jgi:hypothetical protein
VHGDDTNHAFTVEIPSDRNVSMLKYYIRDKKKPEFDHVAADALNLWKVRMHIEGVVTSG